MYYRGLDSFLSSALASSKLDGSIFLYIFDVDQSDLIDRFENTISCQSTSSEDDTYLLESDALSFFEYLFRQNLSSVRCAFFTSFVSEFPCPSSKYFITVFIN
jgi:hypothetical protein